jgi:para-nitrobenzyl esterase
LIVQTFVATTGINKTPAAVLAQYPLSAYQNKVGLAISAIGTDAIFACPSRKLVRALSGYVPTFAYEFNDPNAPQVFLPPASIPYGSYHASELAYLFDSTTRGGHAPFTPAQEQLAAAMVSYWTQFALAGDPNSPARPHWPAYTQANDAFQSLQPPLPVMTTGFAADHKCAFWDAA